MKWLLFVTVTCWVYLILLWVTHRRRAMNDRLESAVRVKTVESSDQERKKRPSVLRLAARRLATQSLTGRSRRGFEKMQTRLVQAGSPGNLSVAEWVGVKLLISAAGLLLGIFMVILTHGTLNGLASLLCLLLLGWIGPDFWLSKKITARQGEILRELPNVLDLLTVSVEAGLGFDQAMGRVAEKLKGSLGVEFERALREMQLGSQRVPALQRLAQRTGVDAVKSFINAVVQADKLGVGMAQVLRVQAADVRRKRRMDAQERAMKAPVKMLFPLVLFVFPALFVIILGPAALQMVAMFSATH